MTREETLVIMGVLKEAYPLYYSKKAKEELRTAVALWAKQFADDDPVLVTAAVDAIIATDESDFPPSIGKIKNRMYKLTNPNEMTEMEAWGLVSKAIRNGGEFTSKREFDKLPEQIQRIVGSPSALRDWGMLPESTVESVIQSNFMRSYRARMATVKEYNMLPENVKDVVGKLAEGITMPALEGNT